MVRSVLPEDALSLAAHDSLPYSSAGWPSFILLVIKESGSEEAW